MRILVFNNKQNNKAIECLIYLVSWYRFKHESIIALGVKLFQTQQINSIISSVNLCCRLHEYIPSKYLNEFQDLVQHAAKHQSVQVRKWCAKSLSYTNIHGKQFYQMSQDLLLGLIDDQIEGVKINALESLLNYQTKKWRNFKEVFGIIEKMFDNGSWRIQLTIMKSSRNFAQHLNEQQMMIFEKYIERLLQIKEFEFKQIVYQELQQVAQYLKVDFIQNRLINNIKQDLQAIQQKECLIQIYVFVVYLQDCYQRESAMIKKETEQILDEILAKNNIEIIIKIIQGLKSKDLKLKIFDQKFDQLEILFQSPNYLLKLEAIEMLGDILNKTTVDCLFNSILKLVSQLLLDKINVVRQKTVELCVSLFNHIQSYQRKLLVLEIFEQNRVHKDYLIRKNYLKFIQGVIQFLSLKDQTVQIESIKKLIDDKSPIITHIALKILIDFYKTKNQQEEINHIMWLVPTEQINQDYLLWDFIEKNKTQEQMNCSLGI